MATAALHWPNLDATNAPSSHLHVVYVEASPQTPCSLSTSVLCLSLSSFHVRKCCVLHGSGGAHSGGSQVDDSRVRRGTERERDGETQHRARAQAKEGPNREHGRAAGRRQAAPPLAPAGCTAAATCRHGAAAASCSAAGSRGSKQPPQIRSATFMGICRGNRWSLKGGWGSPTLWAQAAAAGGVVPIRPRGPCQPALLQPQPSARRSALPPAVLCSVSPQPAPLLPAGNHPANHPSFFPSPPLLSHRPTSSIWVE